MDTEKRAHLTRLKIADKLVNGLIRNNVKVENIFVAPLVQPMPVNNQFGGNSSTLWKLS